METVLAILVGVLFASSIYLILDQNLIRFIFGLVLVSNAINLLIFTVGGLSDGQPPLLSAGEKAAAAYANALPQALILTAIVIGFAILVFLFVLFYRTYEALGTVDTELMRVNKFPER
jgi:multicomponent Na+:H+ antiporter subunit C